MASWDRLRDFLDKYSLTYMWESDLNGDNKKVPGYAIQRRGYLLLYDTKKPLGLLPSHVLGEMTDTELEDFVVQCAVLSMEPDIWQA